MEKCSCKIRKSKWEFWDRNKKKFQDKKLEEITEKILNRLQMLADKQKIDTNKFLMLCNIERNTEANKWFLKLLSKNYGKKITAWSFFMGLREVNKNCPVHKGD